MFLAVTVDLELTGVESLRKSDMNAAWKVAWRAVGKRWRRRFLPKHFGNRAETRYGYTPRSWRYEHNKLKFLQHTRPLEFSGEARREAEHRERLLVTRDKCVVRLPRKFNLRHPKSEVRMADEIRAVREDEAFQLSRLLIEVLERELRRLGADNARVRRAPPARAAA